MIDTDVTDAGLQLKNGAVGVIPTDTVYGIVASAFQPKAIDRLYAIKNRPTTKSCIVLLHSINDLSLFDIPKKFTKLCNEYWPGPVSIILPITNIAKFKHIHRGLNTIAFRVADNTLLNELLSISGPLIAPSANPSGKEPATTVTQAKEYFGSSIDFYIDGGARNNKLSTVIDGVTGNILRK